MTAARRAVVFAVGLSAGLLVLAALGGGLGLGSQARGVLAGMGGGGLLVGLLLWFTPGDCRDSAPPALSRRYYREFGAPMAGYFAVAFGWHRLLDMVQSTWLRAAVALLPALLVGLVVRAIARYVRDSDEMQRRIELESIGIAAGLTATAFMAGGFLQSAHLIAVPGNVAMLWVFPSLCLCYGVAKLLIARRYV